MLRCDFQPRQSEVLMMTIESDKWQDNLVHLNSKRPNTFLFDVRIDIFIDIKLSTYQYPIKVNVRCGLIV